VRTPRAIVLALAVAPLLAPYASAAGNPAVPNTARVTTRGLTADTTRGSWCSWYQTSKRTWVWSCADYAYPLPTEAFLPITRGAVVRVDTRRPANDVTATLRHVDGDDESVVGPAMTGTPVDSSRRIWQLRLPQRIGGASALSITAHWWKDPGDANWWAGVRPVSDWPFRRPPYDRKSEGGWAPKHAIVQTHGLTTGTALGQYCSERKQEGNVHVVGCTFTEYPLHPRTTVPITPRGVVLVDVRQPANVDVTATLRRVEGNRTSVVGRAMTGEPVNGRRRIWRLRLPQQIGGANNLSVTARFTRRTDANFWAGVRPFRSWP
jgi:hypothetical protein